MRMTRGVVWWVAGTVVLGVTLACQEDVARVTGDVPPPPALPAVPEAQVTAPEPTPLVEESRVLLGRDTLGAILQRTSLPTDEQLKLLGSLGDALDVRRMRPSDALTLRTTDGTLDRILVERTQDGIPQTVTIERTTDGWKAASVTAQVEVRRAQVAGRIQSTLYETMVAQKEMPSLINAFVDAFGSTLDFYRDVQNGDEFRLLVEKRYAGERFIGYGRVLAAEYKQTGRTLHAFHAETRDGTRGHYDDKGRSTVTAFLRTPMEFTRITSRFGMRFHPVLHQKKAHNGVDYGAPRGTPIWSVGDGKVVKAEFDATCGNHVLIAHPNGITTGYCHLSRYGAGVRQGVRVSQRQIIGYVGATGRATGPHLHFLMKKGGAFVNPQKIEAPRKPGLLGTDLKAFQDSLPALLAELAAIPVA